VSALHNRLFPCSIRLRQSRFSYTGKNSPVATLAFDVVLRTRIEAVIVDSHVSVPGWVHQRAEIPPSSSLAPRRVLSAGVPVSEHIRAVITVATNSDVGDLANRRDEFEQCVLKNGILLTLEVADGWRKTWQAAVGDVQHQL